jgi:uncharacterized membrane protein
MQHKLGFQGYGYFSREKTHLLLRKGTGMETQMGFVASLLDRSFSQFITPKLVKILFVLGIIASVIYPIIFIVSGFRGSVSAGILMLILSPLFFLLMVIILRVYLELILIMFRIEENTRGLRKEADSAAGQA